MELALAISLALTLIWVPIFRTEGTFGIDYAKEWLFIALTGVMLVISLIFGNLPTTSNYWFLSFFSFCACSLFWCDHQVLGRKETVRLAAILVFVCIASQFPKDFLILACFLPAPVIAAYGISQQIWRRDFCDPRVEKCLTKRTRFIGWAISANHTASYLVLPTFLGLWLTVNHSWIYGIPTTIVLLGLAISQCRAAQLAVILGLAMLFPWAIPVLAICGFIAYRKYPGCMESIGHRFLMSRAAFEIWKKWPLFGAGPRCFRHKHTRATAELNLKDETILGRPGKPGRYQFTVGRRAHNDYVETLAEYGLIGVLLAAVMMTTFLISLKSDWILFAGVIAVLVNAGLFYPFRDTMIAMPFWTVVATTGIGTQMPVGLVPALIGSTLVLYLTYLYAYKPFMANWVSDRGDLLKALQYQPYATEYLYNIAHEALLKNQYVLAFNCAEKCLFFYDGERPEYACLQNFGQAAMANGAFVVADNAYTQALILHPTDPIVLKSIRELRRITGEMVGLNQKEDHEKQAA